MGTIGKHCENNRRQAQAGAGTGVAKTENCASRRCAGTALISSGSWRVELILTPSRPELAQQRLREACLLLRNLEVALAVAGKIITAF